MTARVPGSPKIGNMLPSKQKLLPAKAAFVFCASLQHSQVSLGVGLSLVHKHPTVSSSLEPYGFLLVVEPSIKLGC